MKPFLFGRKNAETQPLKTPHTHPPVPAAGAVKAAPATALEPSIEVIKQGDKVSRLIILCSCGERIEIDCLYPAGG